MSALKEVYDAFSQRIRSPIFGYVILAFFFVNWKPLFNLFFSNEEISERIMYLEDNTSCTTLLILPLVFGLLAALTGPWVSLLGAMWAKFPTNKRRIREVRAANEVSKIRNELREEQNREIDALIASSKQDAEIQNIEDENVRQNIQNQINEIRDDNLKLDLNESKLNNHKQIGIYRELKRLEQIGEIAHRENDIELIEKINSRLNLLTSEFIDDATQHHEKTKLDN